MQSEARVVVVGGGIGGLSALYHLTQEGWTDVVLLERSELTSGTTWHSAAQCPSVAFNQLLLLLRDYTIKLYQELADDPAYPIDYHDGTGGMRLLTDPTHVDECRHILSVARGPWGWISTSWMPPRPNAGTRSSIAKASWPHFGTTGAAILILRNCVRPSQPAHGGQAQPSIGIHRSRD